MPPSIPPDIRGLIIDMDGVLWKDKEAIIDLRFVFQRIICSGYKYFLATNNSSRTPQQYREKLLGFGVDIGIEHIITSSMVAAHLVKKRFPSGGPVYLIGEIGLSSAFSEMGFYETTAENPLAVIVGLDRQFTFDKLKTANFFIRKGAAFYATNPDKTFPTPQGIGPGAGSIIASVETASGIKPIFAGKPEPAMIEYALEEMDLKPEETLQVGDRLDTDILGGIRANCKTALVLSGISTMEELTSSEIKPDFIFEDLQSMFN